MGIHGVLWQWKNAAPSTPPRMDNRKGQVAVELNLMPTPSVATPAPTPPASQQLDPAPKDTEPNPEAKPDPLPDVQEMPQTEPEPDDIPKQEAPPKPKTPAPQPSPPKELKPVPKPVPQAPEQSVAPIGIEQPARPTVKTSPVYPRLSRRRGEQGTVIIRLTVTAKGQAENIVIQQSSGYPLLDKAAWKAIRQSTFEPAQRAGKAVTSTLEQTIVFELEN